MATLSQFFVLDPQRFASEILAEERRVSRPIHRSRRNGARVCVCEACLHGKHQGCEDGECPCVHKELRAELDCARPI